MTMTMPAFLGTGVIPLFKDQVQPKANQRGAENAQDGNGPVQLTGLDQIIRIGVCHHGGAFFFPDQVLLKQPITPPFNISLIVNA